MKKYDFSDLQFLRTKQKHLIVLVDCKNSAVFHVYSVRSARLRSLSDEELWKRCSSEVNSVRVVDEKKVDALIKSYAIYPNGEFHLYTSHHVIHTSNVHTDVDELISTLREYADALKITLFFNEVPVTHYSLAEDCSTEDELTPEEKETIETLLAKYEDLFEPLTEKEKECVIPGTSTDHPWEGFII
ncbi:MAG: hypothetical protein HFJ58_05235 [Clostridia bacterium]|nr:hypothetical protein [Clostridia bacterium]